MKYLFMLAGALLLFACSSGDEHYYQTHPQILQETVKNCPEKQPSQLTCHQLTAIAVATNELAYQLQLNPQEFGKKILSLQQTIAIQALNLKANPNQTELRASLDKNKLLLEQCLAVVKWLESPEN